MPTPRHSGVFISYARSDGSDYAAWLRRKLREEQPDIELWQDIISERSGRDWWLQIADALDHVGYMVMVATPDAINSEAVRKEWRYARQQGVCVLPVQASEALDFTSLPRWMKTAHFADIKVEAQWEVFAADLRRPCKTPRVPFMADDLPADFVARPGEFEPIVRLLLDQTHDQRKPIGITTALRGAGGFGKTTLAKAICHDERIQEAFDDGILWVTLGEKVDNLPGKVAELTTILSGESTAFAGLDPAKSRLRELLADRDILMVIDDVWDAAHLEPFLQGGPHCARLITTRNLNTLPPQSRDVKVDSMRPDEAAKLLGAGLPVNCMPELTVLAERLGNWPLLLGMANGVIRERVNRMQQPLRGAISYANKALERRGLTAFDSSDPKERRRAVTLTVGLSLDHFSPDEGERKRFEELSIFPEDAEIPLTVVATLWQATGNLDEFEAEDLCVRLHRYSLLHTLNLETHYIRLHDVMREFLHSALSKRTEAKLVHGQFIDALKDPHRLAEPYAWRWYTYHLESADRAAYLRELLLDPEWLEAKLVATDVASLAADFDRLPKDSDLELVQGAVLRSAHLIGRDQTQFASQMVGRLLPHGERTAIKNLMARIIDLGRTAWLRPLHSALNPPGTALIRTMESHTGFVNGVALTEDGQIAVSASLDRTLKIWDLVTGHERRTLVGHSDSVNAVALIEDGKHAVSASRDHTLKVWELSSGQELRTLTGHTAGVNGVAVTPDGQWVVSASSDKTLKVWELGSGRDLRTLTGHRGVVNGVTVTPDGRWVISASSDGTLKVWELGSGYELRTLTGHRGEVHGVAVNGDGTFAVSASGDGTLKMWALDSGQQLGTLTGHTTGVTSVSVTGDGRLAISASRDQTLRVWDLNSKRELRTLQGHARWVTGVALRKDGRLAVSGSDDKTLKLWEVASGPRPRTVKGHSSRVNAVALEGGGKLAVSASDDGTLRVWQVSSGHELSTLAGHMGGVYGVALSGNGSLAVSASYDQTLKVWQLASGRQLHTLTGHTDSVHSVAMSADGRLAVSGSWDRTVTVWDVASGRRVRTLKGHAGLVSGVAISGDGRLAVSTSWEDLKVWEVASGRELRTLHGHRRLIYAVEISDDGRVMASASRDQTVKVWEVASGRELRTLTGHRDDVAGLALSEDGRMVVSASRDGTVKVWKVETGECLATFTCDSEATCCAYSEALDLIVAGDISGHLYFLHLETPDKRKLQG